jgi:uncharacterized protein (DUF302 family)
MRHAILCCLLFPVIAMATPAGVTTYRSAFDVATTIDRLSAIATSKGLTVFARIDFAHDARAAGLTLRDEQLLVFGNPKAGTALLQAVPSAGLDLPLKALAYTDADGTTWIAFNEPAYIVGRHAVPAELEANIRGATALIKMAAGDASP